MATQGLTDLLGLPASGTPFNAQDLALFIGYKVLRYGNNLLRYPAFTQQWICDPLGWDWEQLFNRGNDAILPLRRLSLRAFYLQQEQHISPALSQLLFGSSASDIIPLGEDRFAIEGFATLLLAPPPGDSGRRLEDLCSDLGPSRWYTYSWKIINAPSDPTWRLD